MYVYTETDKPLLSVELRFLIINIAILKEYVLYMYDNFTLDMFF